MQEYSSHFLLFQTFLKMILKIIAPERNLFFIGIPSLVIGVFGAFYSIVYQVSQTKSERLLELGFLNLVVVIQQIQSNIRRNILVYFHVQYATVTQRQSFRVIQIVGENRCSI